MPDLKTISFNYGVSFADTKVIHAVLTANGKHTCLNGLVILAEQQLNRVFTANDYLLLGYLIGYCSAADEAERHSMYLSWVRQN